MMGGMTTAWVVARRLALSPDPRQRWRQISLVLASLLGTAAILTGMGVVNAGWVASQHVVGRQPLLAGQPGPGPVPGAPAQWSKSMPVLPEGVGQVPIIWVDPSSGHEGDAALVPPGLDALPEPGAAVLSPGLVDRGISAEDLGLQPSEAGSGVGGVIGDAGLASRSEGFAYARPPAGQSVEQDLAISISGWAPAGRWEVAGSPRRFPWVETVLDTPTLVPAVFGVLWLIVVPSMLLMVGTARAVSEVTRQRGQRLWELGVARSSIRAVAALETFVLAAAGTVAGLLLWWVALRSRPTFPLTDGQLLPGSTRVPLWVALPVALVLILIVVVAASTLRLSPRPERSRGSVGQTLGIVPLVVGLTLITVAPWVFVTAGANGAADMQANLLLGGALLVLVGLPLALPGIVSALARFAPASSAPSVWLAARRLARRPQVYTRTGALVGSLAFISGSALALVLATMPQEWHPAGEERIVWSVDYEDAPEGFGAVVQERADAAGAWVAPLRKGAVEFPSCDDAAEFIGIPQEELKCSSDGARLNTGIQVRLTDEPSPPGESFLISGPRDWSATDALPLLAGSTAPGLYEEVGPNRHHVNPGADWFSAGWGACCLLLLVALVRSLGDHTLRATAEARELAMPGLLPREVDRVSIATTLAPVVLAVAIGCAAAVLFALRGFSVGYTTSSVGLVSAAALGSGALAVVVVLAGVWWQRHLDRRG
ncbi:Uncharacterised protein [Kytococcus sedentarius]|nr:Uncharacterised protein [Kytococcus sedentarius]